MQQSLKSTLNLLRIVQQLQVRQLFSTWYEVQIKLLSLLFFYYRIGVMQDGKLVRKTYVFG